MEKEKQIQESEPQNVTLPHDLMVSHIIPRLPLKPLMRFKCVSKSWLSSISSPEFAKSHLKLSPSSSPHQFLLFSGNRNGAPHNPLFTSLTLDEHGRVQDTTNLGFTHNGGPIHVAGCCNGLVCFFDRRIRFTICNPVTQQCSQIPAISTPGFNPITVIATGFCHVSSIDDYRIVCLIGISDNYLYAEDIDLVGVHIFSSATQQWREFSCVGTHVHGVAIVRGDVPVQVGDTLYWFAENVNVVFGVNLVSGEFSAIPFSLIEFFSLPIPYEGTKLFTTNGRLSICCYRQGWVLNEDGSSWTKLYDLNHQGMRLLCACETTGKWLVLNGGAVALLDPSRSYAVQYHGGTAFVGPISRAWNFKPGLISPFLE